MKALAFSVLGLLGTAAATAQPTTITIDGLNADYEIRDFEGFGLTAQDGGDQTLSVINDQSEPVAEIRSIFQFDLNDLGVQFSSISSVTLRLTLESIENFPAQPVGIWGSSSLRTGPVLATDVGATDEFDAASYGLIQSDAIVVTDPMLTDVVYDIDVTAFATARIGAFDLSPAESVMLFRAQVSSAFGAEFYNLYSADASAGFRPALIVDGIAVPSPVSALGLGVPGVLAFRRRR